MMKGTYILRKPSLEEKLDILTGYAKYDISCSCGVGSQRINRGGRWFYPSTLPDGRKIILLKILLTSVCENDCRYCALRKARRCRRAYIHSEELAKVTYQLYNKGLIKGLFLTSGVMSDPIKTQTLMIDTVKILRKRYMFGGYIHLKLLPGIDRGSIEEAIRWSTRVSINLESPSEEYLSRLSDVKRFSGIMETLSYASRLVSLKNRGSITTQFIVGAAGEKDMDYVKMLFKLYKNYRIERVYFSAFQPIRGTPMENEEPENPLREHRLYQIDFLIRRYRFEFKDIVFKEDGNLDINFDPKVLWVRRNEGMFPVEINEAPYEVLIRVPGIGPRIARKIIKIRRERRIKDVKVLRKLGISIKRTGGYILLDGKRIPQYKSLF